MVVYHDVSRDRYDSVRIMCIHSLLEGLWSLLTVLEISSFMELNVDSAWIWNWISNGQTNLSFSGLSMLQKVNSRAKGVWKNSESILRFFLYHPHDIFVCFKSEQPFVQYLEKSHF